jgi:hypothetical protein
MDQTQQSSLNIAAGGSMSPAGEAQVLSLYSREDIVSFVQTIRVPLKLRAHKHNIRDLHMVYLIHSSSQQPRPHLLQAGILVHMRYEGQFSTAARKYSC